MRIGNHIDKVYVKNGNMADNIAAAKTIIEKKVGIEINTAAIFVAGPRAYKINIHQDEYDNIRQLHIDLFVHNAYISNPWGTNKKQAIHLVHEQLKICDNIGAKGLVVHLPKGTIDDVLTVLPSLFLPDIRVKIYLEIPALLPKYSIFHKTEYLNELFHRIKQQVDPHLIHFGLCIDTAHLWSCGLDISGYTVAHDWINALRINPNNVLIHLNDNEKPLGKAPDIHAVLTHGKIWYSYKDDIKNSGLYAFVKYAMINKIPTILERAYPEVIMDYQILKTI